MNWAIQTKSLSKKYKGIPAVENLNLEVPEGSVFALLGPNGAGKSTILKLIMGLQRPTFGGGFCLGMDILTSGLQIRQKVGYVGEETRFYGYMTVKQIMEFCRGFYQEWDDEMVEHYLDVFKLPFRVKVHELSQGMKNQLALVLALAPRPELLILDEPTTGFDPIKRRIFFGAVLGEMVSRGKTVLMSSHQLLDVERVADRVALIRDGILLKTCSLDELRENEKEIRVVFQKEPPPELFKKPGVSQVHRDGLVYRITITENLEETWQECVSFPHYVIEVINPDLEEIFLRYMEGEK
ncbi:MAG: ABC transporter ATP-binding protein [Bacillota bacterium]|nr:ABC transporter ATP-binding protein [Bacillota bacterium]